MLFPPDVYANCCSQTGAKGLEQEGKTAEQNYKKDAGNNAQFGKDEFSALKGVSCSFLLLWPLQLQFQL